MRVTLLGHASYLVETRDLSILCDPVFHDGFADGIGASCPRRVVDVDALPATIDVLFLSHRHHDHFDVATLASLVGRVELVVCPTDPVIERAIAALGFGAVEPIGDDQALALGRTEVRFTPSLFKVPEHGLLVTDDSGRLWNQVDSVFDVEWLPQLRGGGRGVDVHLANFQPTLQHEVFTHGSTRFPHEHYGELLDVVRAVEARLVVPSASGFRHQGPQRWLNPFAFPVDRARFQRDVRRCMPRSACELLDPGDVVEMATGAAPRVLRQCSPLARTVDASTAELTFDPSAPVPPLVDDNPAGLSAAEIDAGVTAVLAHVRDGLAEDRLGSWTRLLRRWGVVMRVAIHQGARVRHHRIDFTADPPRLLDGNGESDFVFATTASGLAAVERGVMWDRFLAGGFRAHASVCRVHEEGVVAPRPASQGRTAAGGLPSPSDVFLTLWRPDESRWVDRLVDEHASGAAAHAPI